jgi:mycothiol S-conjugate amidase
MTYPADQQGYPHPDHLRVHEITEPAIALAAKAAEPWAVSKVYTTMWSRARIQAMHDKYLELGLESPYDKGWFERPSQDHLMTTKIDISSVPHVRREALLAHATQVDPTSKFWFGLPPEVADQIYPVEDFVLVSGPRTEGLENDLFTGVRAPR